MDTNNLEDIFNKLQNEFDIEEPQKNHEQRFLSKLNNQNNEKSVHKIKARFWKPLLGIAASMALIVTLIFANKFDAHATGLASVSPEMAKTENFFKSTISLELKKLESATNPETGILIMDAMTQLNRLEKEYETLKTDLSVSGNDERVIYAMITNFQNRITILQNTLEQIEHIKQLNNNTDENTNTF